MLLSTTPEQALQRMLVDGHRRAATIGADHEALWAALTEAMTGTHPLPALVSATHEALGGQDQETAAVAGAAVELLHTALVIQRDVLDRRDVRGGRLNLSGSFRVLATSAGALPETARHLGHTAGILAGNLALAAALRALATCPAPPATVHRLLDLVDRALHKATAGELGEVQVAVGGRSPSVADILMLADRKSGATAFELPLQAGAVVAGADTHVVERLGEAGRLLGVAFGLRDDLLGVFGDPGVTGVNTLLDPRAAARSAVIAHARTTPAWEGIAPYVGRPDLSAAEVAVVRAQLLDCGAKRHIDALADGYAAAASAVFEDLGLDSLFVLSVAHLLGRGVLQAA